MRFVLLSIEFDAGTFSGNGVYACSQVSCGRLPVFLSCSGCCAAPPAHPCTHTWPLPPSRRARCRCCRPANAGPCADAAGASSAGGGGCAPWLRRAIDCRSGHHRPAATCTGQPDPACEAWVGGWLQELCADLALARRLAFSPPQNHPASPAPHTLLQVPLPTWGRLDAGCAWREYAAGVAAPAVAAAVSAFRPDAVLGVDWHSVGAYDALAAAAAATTTGGSSGSSGGLPYIFLNYRCGAAPACVRQGLRVHCCPASLHVPQDLQKQARGVQAPPSLLRATLPACQGVPSHCLRR